MVYAEPRSSFEIGSLGAGWMFGICFLLAWGRKKGARLVGVREMDVDGLLGVFAGLFTAVICSYILAWGGFISVFGGGIDITSISMLYENGQTFWLYQEVSSQP